MTQFKKFKDFSKNEDVNQNWQEELLQALKEANFFSGDENPFGQILDRVFSEGEKPTKEDVKQHLMKYLEEAVEMSFGEEWNESKESNPETPITPDA